MKTNRLEIAVDSCEKRELNFPPVLVVASDTWIITTQRTSMVTSGGDYGIAGRFAPRVERKGSAGELRRCIVEGRLSRQLAKCQATAGREHALLLTFPLRAYMRKSVGTVDSHVRPELEYYHIVELFDIVNTYGTQLLFAEPSYAPRVVALYFISYLKRLQLT